MNILSNKRIALVYDWIDKWGGAERILLALHEMFPEAPLYTAVYDPVKAPWAAVFPKIYASWFKGPHEWFPWLMPPIFESFNFDNYDLVISVTSFAAKGIITKPHTKHICYCLTPTRYLWSHAEDYQKQVPSFIRPLFTYLKWWDLAASSRPDKYIAISQTVQKRIKDYYGCNSNIVFPPTETSDFNKVRPAPIEKDYFLYVGRPVKYKNGDLVEKTCKKLKLPLVVLGKKFVSNETLISYYQHCKAVIFFHEEDFGLVPVEAMACGKPVIGLNRGGVTETVVNKQTGLLGDNLENLLLDFPNYKFDANVIKARAKVFDKSVFMRQFLLECSS